VDLLVIVSALLGFLLGRPTPQRLLDVDLGVFAADHEANLARWICGDSGETVLGNWKDFTTRLLDVLDQVEVQPLIFGYASGRLLARCSRERGLVLKRAERNEYNELSITNLV